MAGIESIWFAPWVQLTHLVFLSVARSIPQRVAHPPPWPYLATALRPTESR
jgi:hypothetical protein